MGKYLVWNLLTILLTGGANKKSLALLTLVDDQVVYIVGRDLARSRLSREGISLAGGGVNEGV